MKRITTMSLFAALLAGAPVNYMLAEDVTVKTEAELRAAIQDGNVITVQGEITLEDKIEIRGKAVTIKGGTLNGNNKCQILNVVAKSNVTLEGITLKNGYNEQSDTNTQPQGGAVRANDCTLTVKGCTFENNKVTLTDFQNWCGGAIHFQNATATIENSTFKGNQGFHGGALTFFNATGKISDCKFIGNKAVAIAENDNNSRGGGALLVRWDSNAAKTLEVTSCEFSENTATRKGGAIYFMTGGGGATKDTDNNKFTVSNSIFRNNKTTSDSYSCEGGAVFLSTERAVTVNFLASTFTGNESRNNGGAIQMDGVEASEHNVKINIVNCAITGNRITGNGGGGVYNNRIPTYNTTSINIVNTIIAGNKCNTATTPTNSDFRIEAGKCQSIKSLKNCLIRDLNESDKLGDGQEGANIDVTGTIYNDNTGLYDAENNIVETDDGYYAVINGAAAMRFTGAKALAQAYGVTTDQLGNALTDEVIGAVQKVAVPVVGKMGMATVCSPVGLDFTGTSLTAYSAKQSGGYVNLTKVDGAIKAKEGVIVVPDEDITDDEKFYVTAVDNGSAIDGNELKGVTEKTDLPEGAYVLSIENEVRGFYKASADGQIAACKAYLDLGNTSEAKSFAIVFGGDTTGISNVETAAKATDGAWYTLSGVKVSQPTARGIYVRNGKKYVVK